MTPSSLDSAPVRILDRLLPPARPEARAAACTTRLWGAQLALGVVVFIAAQTAGLVAGVFLGYLVGEFDTGMTPDQVQAQAVTYSAYPVGFVGGSVVSAVVALVGYWGLMRLVRGVRVSELAGRGSVSELVAGLGTGTLLMALVIGVLAVLGSYRVVTVGWDPGILVGLGAGIMAGFAEEILFRGVLLRLAERWLGTWWALALTSVLFGGVHLTNSEATVVGVVAIMLEAGVLLGACYVVTRRLWLAIGLHVAWNFVQGGVFGSDISGVGTGRGLFEARFTGPDLLTGGAMGIEGSLVTIVACTAAGILMVLVAARRGLVVAPAWKRRRPASGGRPDAGA